MAVNVEMPQLGESVVEGVISKWLVKVGDAVKKDQPIVEIATDKADTEVPSPTSGVITQLLANEGQTIAVRTPIAVIDESGAGAAAKPAAAAPPAQPTAPQGAPAETAGSPRTSPAVRTASRELGVDLATVQGSGENGRITKGDVEKAAKTATPPQPPPQQAKTATPPQPPQAQPPQAQSTQASQQQGGAPAPGAFRVPPFVEAPGDEIIPFNRRRRIIADHMVYSKHVAPHVMTIAEIDMFKTHKLREAKKNALKAEGVSLTFLSFIAAATVRALRENPTMNARVLNDAYVKIKRINLGIAVETPQGLVVPVIKDADMLTVRGLARAIDDTAVKARDGKLTADDLAGATFSLSNPGLKGNFVGAAIISQPNVGILRVGEIVKRPVVVEVDGQDVIAIHPVMFAALSYDHRIVDGVAANNFLHRVTEIIEAGEFEI